MDRIYNYISHIRICHQFRFDECKGKSNSDKDSYFEKDIRLNQTLRYHCTGKQSPTHYILDNNIVNLILDHLQDNYVNNDISTSYSEDETKNKRTL